MKKKLTLFIYVLIWIPSFGQVGVPSKSKEDSLKMIDAINILIDVKEFSDSLYENIQNKQIRKKVRDSLFIAKQVYGNNRVEALFTLYSNPNYYSRMNYYQDSLISALLHDYREKRAIKETTVLLSLMGLPDEIKSSIANDKNTPDFIKARLGNLEEEGLIINDFIDKVNTQSLKVGNFNNSVWMLLFINSENTMNVFFKYFQSDKIYISPIVEDAFYFYKTEYSLFSNLIYELYLFYPEPVFDIRGNRYKQYVEESNYNSELESYEILSPYYKKVEEIIRIKFKIDVKINAPLINKKIITSWK